MVTVMLLLEIIQEVSLTVEVAGTFHDWLLNHRYFVLRKVIKSFLQGFGPGIVLKVFLLFLPMIMYKVEGHVSLSNIERKAAASYYYFILVNNFLGA